MIPCYVLGLWTGDGLDLDRKLNLAQGLVAALAKTTQLWVHAWGAVLLALALWSLAPFVVGPLRLLWAPFGVIALLVFLGGLGRLAVSENVSEARAIGLGPAGLQLGMGEVRLLGAGLLCAVFMSMILSVVALVLLAAFGVAELDAAAIEADRWAEVGPAWKLTALSVLTLGLGFAVIALAARLSLFVPATLAKARMISLNAIALSRGAFAPLVIGLILTGVPKLVLLVLSGLGLLSGQGSWFVWVAVIALLEAPLTLSFLGWAYRKLDAKRT